MSLGALVRPDIQRETRETHPAETGAHLLVVMTQQELLEREVRKETQLGLSHIVFTLLYPGSDQSTLSRSVDSTGNVGQKTNICV